MQIGDFISQRLEELDMSYADLARELTLRGKSTSRANVGHWVRGRHSPPMDDPGFRIALAAALQLDVNDLMSKAGYAIIEAERSREALRAADIVDRLPSDAKSLALEYLDMLDRRYVKTG